jgi:hypothetical protein
MREQAGLSAFSICNDWQKCVILEEEIRRVIGAPDRRLSGSAEESKSKYRYDKRQFNA